MEFPVLDHENGDSYNDDATQDDGDAANSVLQRKQQSRTSILPRIPFLNSTPFNGDHDLNDTERSPLRTGSSSKSLGAEVTKPARKRRGSLRKVALLSRGAGRERWENQPPDTNTTTPESVAAISMVPEQLFTTPSRDTISRSGSARLSQTCSPPDEYSMGTSHSEAAGGPLSIMPSIRKSPPMSGPDASYASTTDEEDALQIPERGPQILTMAMSASSSGSEVYLPHRITLQHRQSAQRAKSPLSFSGLSAATIQSEDTDWDYSETEWWGWVVLIVTWFVFVIGMGSCLGVWSWAWDVGTTPYAPPELEDDPSLPMTGYYPALLILSCIMAWVWVVAAWVGMKYFRHAKIGGD